MNATEQQVFLPMGIKSNLRRYMYRFISRIASSECSISLSIVFIDSNSSLVKTTYPLTS